MKTKFYSYKRKKQFSEEIESCIGILDSQNKYDLNIYHPIVYNIAWIGVCHTNVFDVKEITIDTPIKSSLNQKLLN